MLHPLRVFAPWLVGLVLVFFAASAYAQVPQGTTFTGTLVDDLGAPLVGSVDMILGVFDAETAGTELYAEGHPGVPLDATGGFSVQLGLGSPLTGTFDAALFSGTDRWLQVRVDGETLTPRQPIASVPWALIAQQASKIVPDPNAPRFEDCGDGTVADHQTGLQWEQKTGTEGSSVDCAIEDCSDPHDVNNLYVWSDTGMDPDGNAFTDFLARLNGEFDPDAATGCFAGHCDWVLPKISELQTILIGPEAAPGQDQECASGPCIDPDFAAIGGPTASANYWSASSFAGLPSIAWRANFNLGLVFNNIIFKTSGLYVRAVRAGSCN